MTGATLLLLADGRLPAGGHAHSGGLEAAVRAGQVRDGADLAAWLAGRLHTVGRVDAAFAAAAWSVATVVDGSESGPRWLALSAEYAARTPSPALRAASRAQGRGLARVASRCWPSPALAALAGALPDGASWPLALGAAGMAAGLAVEDVTCTAAAAAVQGPGWAATRLLGLDPFVVASCLADLAPAVDRVGEEACGWAVPAADIRALPSGSAPLLEIGAEDHAGWEVRLFAS
jgi:urease accessory protein